MTKALNALTEEEKLTKLSHIVQPNTIYDHIINKYIHVSLYYFSTKVKDDSSYLDLIVNNLTAAENMGLISSVGESDNMIYCATSIGLSLDTNKLYPYDVKVALLQITDNYGKNRLRQQYYDEILPVFVGISPEVIILCLDLLVCKLIYPQIIISFCFDLDIMCLYVFQFKLNFNPNRAILI
jgi:hypothetical protein